MPERAVMGDGELSVSAISEMVGLRREASMIDTDLPLWLARLHRALPVGDQVRFSVKGRLSTDVDIVLAGAGFETTNGVLIRLDTIPDIVSGSMSYLVCGLNPSPHAAESGVGFSRPGNRFWPAARRAELVTADRDPDRALIQHGVGFTDLVKRTTAKAGELTANEFEAGLSRLEGMTGWLQPEVLIMVGLTGWRQATGQADATAGWQNERLGSTRVYLMPNTSGLNAHETEDSLTEHLSQAQRSPLPSQPVGTD